MALRSVTNIHILYSFQAKICELRAVIEAQKQSEEKLAIKMSQTIQQREQELEEIKREMRFSFTPTAHDELREVDKGVVATDAVGTDAAPKPAGSVSIGTIQYDPVNNNSQVWYRVWFSLFRDHVNCVHRHYPLQLPCLREIKESPSTSPVIKVKVKVKQSRYRSGVAQRVPGS
jgi:hypothetical protein